MVQLEERKTVIAGTDRVAVDSYGITIMDVDPFDVPYLINANKRGMGEIDLTKVATKILDLNESG